MQARIATKKFTHREFFDYVYNLAAAGKFDDLQITYDSMENKDLFHVPKDLFGDVLTPAMLLAQNGFFEAAEVMLISFHCSVIEVAEGYARGHHHVKVDELLTIGKMLETDLIANYIIRGYAYAGEKDKVAAMLKDKESLRYAVSGYALAGNVAGVEDMIARGASILDAIWGYVCAGKIENVEDMVMRSQKKQMDENEDYIDKYIFRRFHGYMSMPLASTQFQRLQYFDDENKLLRLLSVIKSDEFRNHIKEQAFINANTKKMNEAKLDVAAIINRSDKIRNIMQKYRLEFDVAKELLRKDVRVWLLQGRLEGHTAQAMPRDIFIKISSYHLGLSVEDTQKLYVAVSKNTHEGALAALDGKYRPNRLVRFFRLQSPQAAHEAALKREGEKLELEKRYHGEERRGVFLK